MGRLTDNSKQWSVFEWGTYGSGRDICFEYCTGTEEAPFNNFKFSISKFHFRMRFFSIIPPWRVKVYPDSWNQDDIERLGRNYYWDVKEREFGFYIFETSLVLLYGKQDFCASSNDKSVKRKHFWIPWRQWRFIRHSLYDHRGVHFFTSTQKEDLAERKKGTDFWDSPYEKRKTLMKDTCPRVKFLIKDCDDEEIVAETFIEEREWRFGEKWCKWLSLFRKPKIHKQLCIEFSSETGKGKGSWKGGTCGTSIKMNPMEEPWFHELHESAMRRYCENEHRSKYGTYKVTFLRKLEEDSPEIVALREKRRLQEIEWEKNRAEDMAKQDIEVCTKRSK